MKAKSAFLVIFLMISVFSFGQSLGRIVGGTSPSTTTIEKAIQNIKAAEQFKSLSDQATLANALQGAVLLKYFTQVVAGSNKTFLLETTRGIECFRVYNRFDGYKRVINYARGDDEEEVLAQCLSFRNMKSKAELRTLALAP